MSHSLPPRSERSSRAPDLPPELAEALKSARETPADEEVWELLSDVCRDLDRPEEAASLYSEVMDSKIDLQTRIQVGLWSANFCEEWFEETEPVLEMLGRVLEMDPAHAEAFERLTVLLTVSSKWPQLLGAYDRAIEFAEEPKEKARLLEEASKVARDFAGDGQKGSDYLKALFLLTPEDEQLAGSLERRLDEQERHQDLVDVWTARLAVTTGASALQLRLSIASRHLEFLKEAEPGLVMLGEFLAQGGDEDEAIGQLEGLAGADWASAEARRTAISTLRSLYEKAEAWADVVRVIESELGLVSQEESAELHREAAALLVNLGQKDLALEHATRVMGLLPLDEAARTEARALATDVNDLNAYVGALLRTADGAEAQLGAKGGARRVELLIEAARLFEIKLAEPARAISTYMRVADDPASDDAAKLLACQELSKLLEASGDRAQLLEYLVRQADLETKAEARALVLGRSARLAEELGDSRRSLALWSVRLADNEHDVEALSERISLLSAAGDSAGLVLDLRLRSKMTGDHEQARDDLVRAADEYVGLLSDVPSAILVYREIEERFGRTESTVDQLILLSEQAGLFEDAAELLGEALELDGVDESRQLSILGRLGEILRVHLKNYPGAASAYQKALLLSPQNQAAQAGLRELLTEESLAHSAGEILADALRRSADFAGLVDLLEVRLTFSPDDEFSASVLTEAAQIEEQAGNIERALLALRRAFAALPSQTTEAELARLAEASDGWEVVSLAYADAIERSDERTQTFALQIARGHVEEERLGRLGPAARCYLGALELDPADAGAARDLIRAALGASMFDEAGLAFVTRTVHAKKFDPELAVFFESAQVVPSAWDDVLHALADKIASAGELDEVVLHDLKRQLAVWHRDAAGDPDSAEIVLRRAVQDHPEESSLRMLAELQRRAPGTRLVETLLLLADQTDDELSVLREAGDVALHRVEDPELAEPILQRAFRAASTRFEALGAATASAARAERAGDQTAAEAEPSKNVGTVPPSACSEEEAVTAWAVDHLVDLELQKDGAKVAVELLSKSASLPFSEEEQVSRTFRAAEVAAVGGLEKKAVALGEAVLERDPRHARAIALLSTLHEKAGRLEELLELRDRELALDLPIERRLELRLDQARVLGELGRPISERTRVLRENITDRSGHEPSIEALAQLLSASDDFEALVDLFETEAAEVVKTERERAADMWVRAGTLAEEQLEDVTRLRTNYRAAVAAFPSKFALDRLASLSGAEEAWSVQAGWLEQRLALTDVATKSAEIASERREIVEQLAKALTLAEELVGAREVLETELAADPHADEERQLLAGIYRTFEDWSALFALLEAGVEVAPTDEARVEYLRRAASVSRRRLSKVEGAVPLLRRAIHLSPDDRALKLELCDCLRECGGYDEASEILGGLLEEFGRRRTKERATVHKLLARIARAAGDLDEALSQAEEAAKIERTEPSILMLLGQLAREKGELDRAEQAYRTLALIVGRRGAPDLDDADSVGESSILFELYQIAQERGNLEQARELIDSALEVATRDPAEALGLEESLRAVGKVDLLLDALDAQLSGLDGAAAARILVTRALILEKNEDLPSALAARLLALGHLPSDLKLVEATRKLAVSLGEEPQLWLHLERLALANEGRPEVSVDLWMRLGKASEAAGDHVQAADRFERAQLTGLRPRKSFIALDRALTALGDQSRIYDALKRFSAAPLAAESPERLADALYRLAAFEIERGALEAATERLKQAAEVSVDTGRALALVQPVIHAQRATPGLVALFLQLARDSADPKLVLLGIVHTAPLPACTLELLDEGLALARSVEDSRALRTLLMRSIELAEEDDALDSVVELLLERAKLAELDAEPALSAKLLSKAAPLLSGDAALETELRVAALEVTLGQAKQATARYERLLSGAPGERAIWQPLLQLYREAGQTEAILATVLEVEKHVESDTDLELLKMERIRLMVSGGRLPEAEAELRAFIEEHPESLDAPAVLVDLLRQADRVEELKELVESLFDAARNREDGALVARYGLELAALHPDDPKEAISILTAGLSYTSDNRAVLERMLSLFTDEDEPRDRAEVLEFLLAIESGPRARQIALELAHLREVDGDNYGVGRALELGFKAAPDDAELCGRYVAYLRQEEDYQRLVDVLTREAARGENGSIQADRLTEIAVIYDEKLGDPGQAARAMQKAFEKRPDDAALLRRGVDYLLVAGDVELALSLLGEAISSGDEMVLADLLDVRARVLWTERADDPDALRQAAEDLRLALEQLLPEEQEREIQSRRAEVLERLRQLYSDQADDVREREMVLEISSQRADTGDEFGALEVLSGFLEMHPDDAVIASMMGKRAVESGQHAAAVSAFRALFLCTEGDAQRDAAVALSSAARSLGEPMEAREALEAVFAERPGDPEVRLHLQEMYLSVGAYRPLAELLLGQVDGAADDQTRFELLVEVGDLLLKADDGPAACEAFERARSFTDSPYTIIGKLADAYVAMGEIDRAQTVLDEALEAHGKRRTPELALLQWGISRVAGFRGDVEGMFTWLEAALMSDRNNGDLASDLAVRAQEAGKHDIALKALQVLTLIKADAPIGKAEAYYRQAQISLEQGDTKKALLLARRAVQADASFIPAVQMADHLGGG